MLEPHQMVALLTPLPGAALQPGSRSWLPGAIACLKTLEKSVAATFTSKWASEFVELKEKLLQMAGYAETAVNRAVKALMRRDDDLARRTDQ